MERLISSMTAIDIIDIAVAYIILYLLYLWFKRTKSVYVFIGIIIASTFYLAAQFLQLRLVVALMHSFFAVILLAVVIIFQEDIRRLFEQVALWGLNSRFKKKKLDLDLERQNEILVETLMALAGDKIGALIILKGNDALDRHMDGGIELDGKLSESLLKSIFDPHSEGHDGAVIVEGGRVTHFGCHLPLSKNAAVLRKKGTRHAAALGLSELSDALCLVVSEERGQVSLARNGELVPVSDREQFLELLQNFEGKADTAPKPFILKDILLQDLGSKIIILLMCLCAWWFFVHESVVVYKSLEVPVEYIKLDETFNVVDVSPSEVKLVLSAPERNFYFMNPDNIRVFLKLVDLEDLTEIGTNRYETTITAADVELPANYSITNIFPRNVRLQIERR